MTTIDLLEVLTRGSVPVVEVAGWRTRDVAGAFTPVAQIDHHTGGRPSSSNPSPSLQTMVKGRPGIPPPLGNGLIDYHGRLLLVSDGRCNDSGKGSGIVLNEIRRGIRPSGTAAARHLVDDTNGNPWFWDWEIEYDGVTQAPNPSQLETLYRVNVAVALAGGGTPIGHLEWTARKIDPANVSMADIRHEFDRRIEALAAMAAGTGPTVDPELSPPASTVGHADRVALNGKVVLRMEVPVHLDDDGNGETGPAEGLHVPYAKLLSCSNTSVNSPNYGAPGEGYLVVPVGPYDKDGQLVVQVESNDKRLARQTVYPVVTVAD